jgi:hypothetical protein
MNKSESIANLAEALLKVQAEMPVVPFDKANKFLGNRYATLGQVIEVSKPLLVENGLSVSQLTLGGDGEIGVETVLIHRSGEWISSVATIPIEPEKGKSMAQVAGSNISYLRRYALASILGIYSDEDTDGNGQGTKGYEPAKPERTPANAKPVSDTVPPSGEKLDGNAPTMTIEGAYKVQTSKGVRYGDMTIPGLKKMLSALYKSYHDGTEKSDDGKALLMTKIQAASMVLKEKESGGM